MDRSSSKSRVRLLVYASSSVSLAVSALFTLLAFMPWFYFHGYVRGYYSPLDYRLYYSLTGEPVALFHTDYIRHVTAVFTALSLLLLALSVLTLALARKSTLVASGLAYGVSCGLVMLYGLLNGYVYRAVGYDIALFNSLVRDTVTVRTLAGTITYEGVRLESLLLHDVAFSTQLIPVLVAIAVSASALALLLATPRSSKEVLGSRSPSGLLGCMQTYVAIGLTSLTLVASVFAYYPSSLSIAPQPPPVSLEAPPYNYTCTALTRTARGALAYTDFETLPTGWTSYGGLWSSVGGVTGAKGNVLQGSDNNQGLGASSSQYYYATDLSVYTSLWVAAKTRYNGVAGGERTQYYGVVMMNAARNRAYAVVLENDRRGLELRSYGVTAAGWATHLNLERQAWYTSGAWYVIVVRYTIVGTTAYFDIFIYSSAGALHLSTSTSITHANVFVPAYIGVMVDGAVAHFDDFEISTTDPRSILFAGFYADMGVEVWDNLGLLVNSTVAPASSFHLNVTADVVVGTGVNGRIVVRYPDGYLCGNLTVPTTDAVLGGDVYILTTRGLNYTLGANKTSGVAWVNISYSEMFTTVSRVLGVNSTRTLYARLVLEYYETMEYLHVNVTIVGRAESTPIVIRGGAPITTATSFVELNTGLANHVFIYGYYTQPVAQVSRLDLRLEICTLPDGRGACVSYPLILVLLGYVG